jgi:hypothetical protein
MWKMNMWKKRKVWARLQQGLGKTFTAEALAAHARCSCTAE